ncbi:MAG: hypothetical protein U0X20_07895 [Caldilineaceae bacterium]
MEAELTKRKRGRPPGHKRFTERLPSVLVTPDDVGKLEEILARRQVSASALMRELINREHRRVLRTADATSKHTEV